MALTNEQEVRARAVAMKLDFMARIASAAIIAKQDITLNMWEDRELEEIVEYITTGKKPEKSPVV